MDHTKQLNKELPRVLIEQEEQTRGYLLDIFYVKKE